MKFTLKNMIALALALCLCLSLTLPAFAAGESNSEGVVFTAELDQDTFTVSDQDQTVTMTVRGSKAFTVCGIGAAVTFDEALTLTAEDIRSADERIDFTDCTSISTLTTGRGKITWTNKVNNNIANLEGVTDLAAVTFTIPAGTEAGTYTVGISEIELIKDIENVWEYGATATATITVVEAEETDPTGPSETVEGYSVSISTLTPNPTVDDTILVDVNVSHDTDTVYAAAELVLTYDNTKLALDTTGLNAKFTDKNGELSLADYGADKNLGSAVYTLTFTALTDGHATVLLKEAAFSDKHNAETSDLIPATLVKDALDITIEKKVYDVTLPEGIGGNATVVDGDTYEFVITDNNYDYSEITATVNGETVTVSYDPETGKYSIANVTGPVVIEYQRTPKVFDVTITGSTAANDGTQATYGTAYTFTLPENVEAGRNPGMMYALESITIGGQTFTGYTVEGRTYTIPGAAITGNVEIVITETDVPVAYFVVTVTGNGAGDVLNTELTVPNGGDYTLELTIQSGFEYIVSATMVGSDSVTVIDNGDCSYTVQNITGDLTFNVEKAVISDGVTLNHYVTLDGLNMYLVRKTSHLEEGSGTTYTYDGNLMYWSDAYNAYCYLVLTDAAMSVDDAKLMIGITAGESVSLPETMDVNQSGNVDASDAQLVYNMYNAQYNEFTQNVTMLKFLLADINGSGNVNVEDAVEIIHDILAIVSEN